MSQKHILVLGATGPSGVAFCVAALQDGHKLTLYVRNPSKMPASVSSNKSVEVIEGTFDDEEKLASAATCGANTFVTFAGPVVSNKGTPVTDCYTKLFPLLIKNDFQRALVLSTPSYVTSEDKGAFKWTAVVALIKVIGGSAFREVTGIGKLTASQPTGKLKWTLFRVPFLTNGNAGAVKASYTGTGQDGLTLSRKSMAAWVLNEMTEDKWVGKAPLLSNA